MQTRTLVVRSRAFFRSGVGRLPDMLAPSGAVRPRARIVHLGLGAFFRGFACAYLTDLGDWGVIGVSLRTATVRDRLRPQDFVYTACEMGPDGVTDRRIEVVRDVIVGPEDPAAVIAAMASPAIDVVSLTVTEKGYCHDPATGQLNMSHPDIRHDLSCDLPRSAPGFLVRGLQARRDAGLPPFTVISCDNLPRNGQLVRSITLRLAREIDPGLSDWIAAHGAFPSSMVDRIVPATTQHDIDALRSRTGTSDASPVMHEPFRQWVIEDQFAAERPALDTAGARFVADVRPFEHMKLRMLNGAHSALAYLGYLAGHKTVSDAVSDVVVSAYLRKLWHREIIPTLVAPPHTDLSAYADALMTRFANPAIRHKTHQIAMDGSQKLPQRLLTSIDAGIAAGRPVQCLLLAVAAWMRYVTGSDDAGHPIDVEDPLAATLAKAQCNDPAKTVRTLLSERAIFDRDLAARIEAPLIDLYEGLCCHGARPMMERVTA